MAARLVPGKRDNIFEHRPVIHAGLPASGSRLAVLEEGSNIIHQRDAPLMAFFG